MSIAQASQLSIEHQAGRSSTPPALLLTSPSSIILENGIFYLVGNMAEKKPIPSNNISCANLNQLLSYNSVFLLKEDRELKIWSCELRKDIVGNFYIIDGAGMWLRSAKTDLYTSVDKGDPELRQFLCFLDESGGMSYIVLTTFFLGNH